MNRLANAKVKHIATKRAFDIIFSTVALAFLSVVFVGLSVAIRAMTKSSAIYSHERIGRGGKKFRCYKFRTMYPDADERLAELLKDPTFKKEWLEKRKLSNDPRVTPLGKFLRKTSLDELPQFWNVLKGDLSVVGPRPVVYEEIVKYYGPKADKILSMRPGLTCIWQVSGRSDVSYSKRLELDEHYIDNHSLMLDLKLIAKTIPNMINSKGAY